MSESNKHTHQNYSKFDNMSTEMLEDILRADAQLISDEDSDENAILYIMEVIAKREKENNTGKFTDVSSAWNSFRKNYLPYTKESQALYDYNPIINSDINPEPSKKSTSVWQRHHLLQFASIALAIPALLFLSTVTAKAFGLDLWGAVANWTKDTFQFSAASFVEDPPNTKSSGLNSNDLQDALDQYGITTLIVPTWYPDGYSFENIDIAESPMRTTFHAVYATSGGEDKEILVTITLLSEPSTSTHEKDSENVTVYQKEGIDYYIMTNLEHVSIVWIIDYCECSITGDFSLEEAQKMIDSIYEGK